MSESAVSLAVSIAVSLSVAAFNLLVFGAHALLPFRLARAGERERQLWAALAPVLLVAACGATAWTIGRRPDEAIAWGLTDPIHGSMPARLIAVALVAVAFSDLFVLFAWRRLEPIAWQFHGVLGVLALAAHALGAELLRIGWGPCSGTFAILAGAALRVPLALAAVEVALGAPRRWALGAAPALLGLALLWPAAMRLALARDLVTLAAAVALLAAARFVPESMRRAAAIAGIVLALLFLARSTELSRAMGTNEQLHEFELEP